MFFYEKPENKLNIEIDNHNQVPTNEPDIEIYKGTDKTTIFVNGADIGQGGGGSSVQSDYEENDVESQSYIKNRPFYEGAPEIVEVELFNNTVPMSDTSSGYTKIPIYNAAGTYLVQEEFIEGDSYIVTIDDIVYNCTCNLDEDNGLFLGSNLFGEDLEFPFTIYSSEFEVRFSTTLSGESHEILITHNNVDIFNDNIQMGYYITDMDNELYTTTASDVTVKNRTFEPVSSNGGSTSWNYSQGDFDASYFVDGARYRVDMSVNGQTKHYDVTALRDGEDGAFERKCVFYDAEDKYVFYLSYDGEYHTQYILASDSDFIGDSTLNIYYEFYQVDPLLPSSTIDDKPVYSSLDSFILSKSLEKDREYNVTIDGTKYECQCLDFDGEFLYLGSELYNDFNLEFPFMIGDDSSNYYFGTTLIGDSHEIRITYDVTVSQIKTLEDKFLPDYLQADSFSDVFYDGAVSAYLGESYTRSYYDSDTGQTVYCDPVESYMLTVWGINYTLIKDDSYKITIGDNVYYTSVNSPYAPALFITDDNKWVCSYIYDDDAGYGLEICVGGDSHYSGEYIENLPIKIESVEAKKTLKPSSLPNFGSENEGSFLTIDESGNIECTQVEVWYPSYY